MHLWVKELAQIPMYEGWSGGALKKLIESLWNDLTPIEKMLIEQVPVALQIDYLCLAFWHFGLDQNLRSYREAERKLLWICGPLSLYAPKAFEKVVRSTEGWKGYFYWKIFSSCFQGRSKGSWEFERLMFLAYEVFLDKKDLSIRSSLSNLNSLDGLFFEMKNKANRWSYMGDDSIKLWNDKERWEALAEFELLRASIGDGRKSVGQRRL